MSNVLVVDDSLVVRKVLSEYFSHHEDLKNTQFAKSGNEAFEMIMKMSPQLPSLIILDYEMPGWDGLETLKKIIENWPQIPVLMFSTLSERGAKLSINALVAGAVDYLPKPTSMENMAQVFAYFDSDLLPKIKHWNKPQDVLVKHETLKLTGNPERHQHKLQVVCIGVSTGGPMALMKVLPNISKDFPVPILIVQHMPPDFTRKLAERLDESCQLKVLEAQEGMLVAKGHIYIAPGDFHMLVKGTSSRPEITLNQLPQENSCRPAVDPLFRSVAEVYQNNALAVVLTGMGMDGLKGSEVLRKSGSEIIVQDEATSAVWGMPGYVAKAGLAQKVLPLDEVAKYLNERFI